MPKRPDEFSLIEQIRSRTVVSDRTRLGIGDDAALLNVSGDADVLVAVDVLMEGVHFDLERTNAEAVGRKALAVNLSDMAAMAARPTATVVGIVLPQRRTDLLAQPLMDGLLGIAAEFDVDLIGGDTNTWDGPLVISVTLLGEPLGSGVVTRSGALAGDWLFVTGALGGSLSGRHLTFQPRVSGAQALHRMVSLHAMIDVSDGIASDVQHLARESGVDMVIDASAIPIHDDVDRSLPDDQRLRHALTDGEDFELLFSVSQEDGRRLVERSPLGIPLSRIGEVTQAEAGCRLRLPDGTLTELPEGGWVHPFGDAS